MTKNSDIRITPTEEQIAKTKKAIESYFLKWCADPNKRENACPYYQIHEPGEPIRGTIMVFHGFAGKPKQMEILADYLFRNGFNIYQIPLAGQAYLPPDKYWAQIDLKPEFRDLLWERVKQDPVLQNFLSNRSGDSPWQLQRPSTAQMLSLISRILKAAPLFADIVLAIERYNDPDFNRYFISSHMNYLHDAQERLAELEAMPGPIYTVGLSVGGAVALALAASQPNRIKKVVAYAPLLEVENGVVERYINLTGPLDLREFSWEQNVSFPVGCLTAANYFGAFIRSDKNVQALKNTPTCLILTQNDDATDNQVIQKFYKALGAQTKGHRCYVYAKSDLVPHPMVDPREVSQGMSNRFWKNMYQETFRFLTQGEINPKNMNSLPEADDLPHLPY
jgi:esterase/lipase